MITAADLKTLILKAEEAKLTALCLLDADAPYVFNNNEKGWADFQGELANGLPIKPEDVRIVGSGRHGFSLKPGKGLRPFQDTSDVDVVVVNEGLFDTLWLSVLQVAYPRPPTPMPIGGWLLETQKSVYTGWLKPNIITVDRTVARPHVQEVLKIRTAWFTSLKRAASHVIRRHEDISGRLYRTWEHAALYHAHSIGALRQSLEQEP
jgi:hypothetical protein